MKTPKKLWIVGMAVGTLVGIAAGIAVGVAVDTSETVRLVRLDPLYIVAALLFCVSVTLLLISSGAISLRRW